MEDLNRQKVNLILNGETNGLVAIAGPCANHKSRQIINEGKKLSKLDQSGLVTLHRQPHWKPRSPRLEGPKPWEGLEDTNYDAALSRMAWAQRKGVKIATELGKTEHINRYSHLLTFAWLGARSLSNYKLQTTIIERSESNLPLGIKNELSGEIDSAMDFIELVNKNREIIRGDSLATLIYRGGSNFNNPNKWIDQYKRVYDSTDGRFIVDVAHGSEMAFDPKAEFKKTISGQIACMENVILLSEQGLNPKGIMIEASDYENPDPYKQTDPNMPFTIALEGIIELHSIIEGKK